MAITVTHAFVSGIADDPKASAAGEVLPSHWNANHVVTGTLRTTLTANINYYVSTTGSDSNGGTNSSTDAWATLQHAMNFIAANIDIAGFAVTINVGAGSFAGLAFKSCVGGGVVQILGAGNASTTITNGPNDGVQNFGECFDTIEALGNTVFYIDALTAHVNFSVGFNGGQGLLATYEESLIFLGNFLNGGPTTNTLKFKTSNGNAGVAVISITANSIFTILQGSPALEISGDGSTTGAAIQAFSFSEVINFGTVNFAAPSDTYTSTTLAFEAGFIFNSASATGTLTNPQGAAFLEGSITGPWPGTLPTPIDNSSSYSIDQTKSVLGSNINYQVPVSGFSLTLGNTDTQVILDPAGVLATGTIVMQALPIDGHVVMIRSSQTVTALTISANVGQTVVAAPTTISAGGIINGLYRVANSTWYF